MEPLRVRPRTSASRRLRTDSGGRFAGLGAPTVYVIDEVFPVPFST